MLYSIRVESIVFWLMLYSLWLKQTKQPTETHSFAFIFCAIEQMLMDFLPIMEIPLVDFVWINESSTRDYSILFLFETPNFSQSIFKLRLNLVKFKI